jgi:hypothetical protein
VIIVNVNLMIQIKDVATTTTILVNLEMYYVIDVIIEEIVNIKLKIFITEKGVMFGDIVEDTIKLDMKNCLNQK